MASQVLRTSYSSWWLVWVAQNQLELKLKGRGHPEESREVSLYSMKKKDKSPDLMGRYQRVLDRE